MTEYAARLAHARLLPDQLGCQIAIGRSVPDWPDRFRVTRLFLHGIHKSAEIGSGVLDPVLVKGLPSPYPLPAEPLASQSIENIVKYK